MPNPIFVPLVAIQAQTRILYILFMHVHFAVKSEADHSRVKQEGVNKDEPRMNTNKHEYEWMSLLQNSSVCEIYHREGL